MIIKTLLSVYLNTHRHNQLVKRVLLILFSGIQIHKCKIHVKTNTPLLVGKLHLCLAIYSHLLQVRHEVLQGDVIGQDNR